MHSEMFCVRCFPCCSFFFILCVSSLAHSFASSRSLPVALYPFLAFTLFWLSRPRMRVLDDAFVTTLFNVHNNLSAPHFVNVLVYRHVCVCVYKHIFIECLCCECCKSKNTYTQSPDNMMPLLCSVQL